MIDDRASSAVERGSELETESVPMHFKLFASRVSSSLLTPCLCVRLNGIEIVRLLDPELGESFVSAARLFVAARLPLLDGLREFGLQKPDYDTNLGNLAPFDDLWVSLKTAGNIAVRLDLAKQLSCLLNAKSRLAWSLDDGDEGGILHNWKVPQATINPTTYSTAALLGNTFDKIVVFQAGVQIRTALDREAARFATMAEDSSSPYEKLLSQLCVHTSLAYEDWLDIETDKMPLTSTASEADEQKNATRVQLSSIDNLLVSLGSLVLNSAGRFRLNESFDEAGPVSNVEFWPTKHTEVHAPLPAELRKLDALSRLVTSFWPDADDPLLRREGRTSRPEQSDEEAEGTLARSNEIEGDSPSLAVCDGRPSGFDENPSIQAMDRRINKVEASLRLLDNTQRQTHSDGAKSQLERLAGLSGWTLLVMVGASYILVKGVLDAAINLVSAIKPVVQR